MGDQRDNIFTKGGRMHAPSPDLLCKFVREAWDSISRGTVIYSFTKCGILNSLDGEEDDALWQDNSSDDNENINKPDSYDNLFGESSDDFFEGFIF